MTMMGTRTSIRAELGEENDHTSFDRTSELAANLAKPPLVLRIT